MLRFINNLRGTLVSFISATDYLLELDAESAARIAPLLDSENSHALALTLFSATQMEVVRVYGRDGATGKFNAGRGEEGTTAAAWPAGSVFEARLTAAFVDALPRQALAMILTNGQDVLVGSDGDVLWDAQVPTYQFS